MAKTAKLFRNGNSQAVRLPREFRFEGDEVRIRKNGDAVVLEPMVPNVRAWLADLRCHPLSKDFMAEGRDQPPAPERKVFE
jgi:antitoxin VapB